jgi:2'-5' RNA ligase
MPDLIAVDVALLLPPDVARLAIELNASLPAAESKGLCLDDNHLPHITLTQLFVDANELPLVAEQIDGVIRTAGPLSLRIGGAALNNATVWLPIDPAAALRDLHERLMRALHGVERQGGTAAAFVDGDARVNDVNWVTMYRLKASFGAFAPHVTLGHASTAPPVEPFEFDAATVAACHLGRFCTCRRILRQWTLTRR